MLQKVFQFSDKHLKELCSLVQFKQSLLKTIWHSMVLEYCSLHGLMSDRTIRIDLPKQIVEHAEKQNGKNVKELLSQCKDHSLEFIGKPMLRLDTATRKKFYDPLCSYLGEDIERVLQHPKCKLVTHIYLCGFLSGQKIAVYSVQKMLPPSLHLKGCGSIFPGINSNVDRGTYFYKMLGKRLEIRNLRNQPTQAIYGTVFSDPSPQVLELQQKNEALEQEVKQMRQDIELLMQTCKETQQQSRILEEEVDQQLEKLTQKLEAQPKLFKQDNQKLRQDVEHCVQQQLNVQQVQERKQLDHMRKQIEKLSQKLNQQSRQLPQTNDRSKLVKGAMVIDQIKNSKCFMLYSIPVCVRMEEM